MFENMGSEGLEESQDRLGGFAAKESDIYNTTIKMAYVTKSAGGATAINFIFDMPDKSEYRETVYVTDKAGKNYYLNKQDNTKKVGLPGFVVADEICLCTLEKPLKDLTAEDKVVQIWDADAKKEMPKSVPVIVDLLGQPVSLGILKQLENKSVKQGDTYVPTAETRDTNVIDKVFHTASRMTIPEVREGKTEPKFWDGWLSRNQGKTRDKTDKAVVGNAGAPRAAGTAPAAGGEPRKSLFGK